MPKLLLSDEVCEAFKNRTIGTFRQTAVRVAPGWNEVPIGDDTLIAFNKHRLPDETDDQLLRRVIFDLHPMRTN